MIALVGAATGSKPETSSSGAPPPQSTAQAQVEDSGLARTGVHMDRLVNANAKRAQLAKRNAEAIAKARREEAKAKPTHDKKKPKPARAKPAHDPQPAPVQDTAPEPVSEPEASYYAPTEAAPPPPPPTPAPSSAPTQEFGIEP